MNIVDVISGENGGGIHLGVCFDASDITCIYAASLFLSAVLLPDWIGCLL
jgi:hypothetical protein